MATEYNPLRGLISNISLVGTDDEIKTQISLLLGIAQIQEAQFKGLDIDFLKWIDAFENGFGTGFAPKQNTALAAYWGQTQKTRPKIRILSETGKDKYWQNQGYYLIEFQPDRANEALSYLLFGSPRELIPQIMNWMTLHLRLQNLDVKTEGGGVYRPPISPKFKDKLQLTLIWRGITEKSQKNHTVEKSVRIMDVNPKTVSLAYLQQLGRKTLNKANNLSFKTGFVKVKYTKWDDGFQTWGYFHNLETGYKIIESIGDLVNKSIDRQHLLYESSASPNETFDQNGKQTLIANKPIRTKAKAPIANMKFYGATILFPYIGHTEQLCNISGYVLKDLSFLDAYND